MAVLNASIFEPCVILDKSTAVLPRAQDVLQASDLAKSGRHQETATDNLLPHDVVRSDRAFCHDILYPHDVAFRGKFGNALDALPNDDRATKAKWPSLVDHLVVSDRAAGRSAKSARDFLEAIEYNVASPRPVRRATDRLTALDTAQSSSTICGVAGKLDFILTYAPYGTGGPSQTIILPSPATGDLAKVDIYRVIRRSRGNDLITSAPYGYRTPSQTVVFQLDEATKENLAVFIEYSTGQKITWRDHHGYMHTGIILDPSTPFTEEKDGRWRVQLDLVETN